MAHFPELPSECPACGAPLPAGVLRSSCPACGAPVEAIQRAPGDLTPGQAARLEAQAAAMNEQMLDAGASNAESAFNLGCVMSAVLVLAATVLVFFLAGRNWILVVLTLVMASLAALWAIMLIADIARNRAMRRTYRRSVEPEISAIARRQQVERSSIERLIRHSLPENAPLRRIMPAPPETELKPGEE